jgi:two-component system, response regulator YesN
LYKILIVDDLLADRVNLREIINGFTKMDIVISGEAANGLDAIEAVEICKPDIIISDIQMPIYDGFELAKNVRIKHPEVKIIFCSFYEEFEFVRKALFLGSYGYVLKPVNVEELKQCILNVISDINHELILQEQSRDYIQAQKFIQLYKPIMADRFIYGLLLGLEDSLSDDVYDKATYLGIPFIKGLYCLLYLEVDDFDKATAGQNIEQRQILSIRIRERLNEVLAATKYPILSRINESHFVCILQSAEHNADSVSAALDECCSNILVGFRKSDISITIAVSNVASDIFELKSLYEYCTYLMKYKFMLGGGKIIKGTDVPFVNSYPDIDFNSMIKDVRCLLHSSNSSDIDEYLDRIFMKLPSTLDEQYLKNMCFMLVTCAQIILNENNVVLTDVVQKDMCILDTLKSFETVLAEKSWIISLFRTINDKLTLKERTKNHQIVNQIIKYIEKNYIKNINLDIVAAGFYYSSNYLNRIFKQEMGETIFDYATKYRIEKAKELLCDYKVKLYEITDLLGYSNPAYFGSIFKKFTGLTPKEYRERHAK